MHHPYSFEENYRRALAKLANSYDNNFPNTEDDWNEVAFFPIDEISRKYRKLHAKVVSDLVKARRTLINAEREDDLLKYGRLNEYGERID
jgi:hypothetical protein